MGLEEVLGAGANRWHGEALVNSSTATCQALIVMVRYLEHDVPRDLFLAGTYGPWARSNRIRYKEAALSHPIAGD